MFRLSFETDNAAFVGEDGRPDRWAIRRQVVRFAGAAGAKIEDGETSGPCVDDNGNTIGTWSLT